MFLPGGFFVYASGVRRMCNVCEDVQLIVWQRLALDDSHEVEYRVSRCLCGVRVLTVVVKSTQEA